MYLLHGQYPWCLSDVTCMFFSFNSMDCQFWFFMNNHKTLYYITNTHLNIGFATIFNQCLSPLTLWVRTHSWRGVLDTTLCDKVCQYLAAGRWFSPGTPVSSTNKTDRHNITEILLKVVLNTITLTLIPHLNYIYR
jgi:hypothetical protein